MSSQPSPEYNIGDIIEYRPYPTRTPTRYTIKNVIDNKYLMEENNYQLDTSLVDDNSTKFYDASSGNFVNQGVSEEFKKNLTAMIQKDLKTGGKRRTRRNKLRKKRRKTNRRKTNRRR